MAIRKRNRISAEYQQASMTDMIFLLLIFFMLTSTLVAPNAIKLLLPRSNIQAEATPSISVSINSRLEYFVETTPIPYSELENILKVKLRNTPEPCISLHAEKSVPIDEVVKVMTIAKNNNYKLILATQPE